MTDEIDSTLKALELAQRTVSDKLGELIERQPLSYANSVERAEQIKANYSATINVLLDLIEAESEFEAENESI